MPLKYGKTHDTTIHIDDEPVLVHIKRFTRTEALAFQREFNRFGTPRGTADVTAEEKAAHDEAARQFVEDSIAAYVTVAPGQIVDDEKPVTSGEDLIRLFCARADVLTALYQAIYVENFAGKAVKNVLSSQPVFSPGSIPTRTPILAGDGPGPTAASAEHSGTASNEAATDGSAPESSGETPKVH